MPDDELGIEREPGLDLGEYELEPDYEQEPTLTQIYSAEEVQRRIAEMATEMIEKYKDKDVLFVAFLNGALPFASQLMFEIAQQDPDFHPDIAFMIVSTYKKGTKAGEPYIVTDLPPDTDIAGRHVVMLDDVVDSGTTAAFMRDQFVARRAEQVDMVALVQKNNPQTFYAYEVLYGFDAPKDDWLTGMGMDNSPHKHEANRWRKDISIVNWIMKKVLKVTPVEG